MALALLQLMTLSSGYVDIINRKYEAESVLRGS
jgi:hypothetical protein